jgi:hypothetical protein
MLDEAGVTVTVGVVFDVVPPPPPPPHAAIQKLARILNQIAACRPLFLITQPLSSLFSSATGFNGTVLAKSPAACALVRGRQPSYH